MNASRLTDLDRTTDSVYAKMIAPKEQGGLGLPANAATKAAARKEAIETTGLALLKVGATENAALATAISKDPQIGEKGTLTSQLKLLQLKKNPSDAEKIKIDDLEDQIAGRRAQLENQIKRSTAKPPAPETPAPAPAPVQALPMPATQTDLVKGKVYNTARGPAEWDGTKFVAVAR
jgi:hypothetical protein